MAITWPASGGPVRLLSSTNARRVIEPDQDYLPCWRTLSWSMLPPATPSYPDSVWVHPGSTCGPSRLLKRPFSPRLLKKAQVQGAATHPLDGYPAETRGVLSTYVAAPRERGNVADGPFSADC